MVMTYFEKYSNNMV